MKKLLPFVLAGLLVLVVGCAPAGGGGSGGGSGGGETTGTGSAPPPPGAKGKGLALRPGFEELGGGRVLARGWVVREGIEGGFWAVVDIQPSPDSSVQPRIVAVLLPGKVTEDAIARMEGTFVGAEGELQEGASVRMAGPEIVVDALRVY